MKSLTMITATYLEGKGGEKKAASLELGISGTKISFNDLKYLTFKHPSSRLFIKHRNSKEPRAVGAHSVFNFPATKKLYLP